MALNGSVSVEATPKGQDLLVFSWSAVQDAAANTSTVSWMMQLVASTAGAINGVPVERDWTVTVDGQEFTGTANVNISNNETKTLASGEIVLEHAEDGTRSFDFAFSQALYITWSGTTEIGVVSGSGTGELDAIVEPEPEPEKFDIQGFMMGLAMALCGRAVQWPKGEPVAFLYNGVRLPKLPEWDEETYPYSYIGYTDINSHDKVKLRICNVPLYYDVNMGRTNIGGSTDYIDYSCMIGDSEWSDMTTGSNYRAGAASGIWGPAFWSNNGFYDESENLILAASDPIPVYE